VKVKGSLLSIFTRIHQKMALMVLVFSAQKPKSTFLVLKGRLESCVLDRYEFLKRCLGELTGYPREI
jgi:hypothetical protein